MTLALLLSVYAEPVGEIWVRAPDETTRAQLDALGLAHAHGVQGEWVQLVGHADALDAAQERFETRDRRSDHRRRERDADLSLDEIEARLRALGPVVQVGTSLEGRPIWGVRLGEPGAPRLRVLGGHHGDEPPSVSLALHVAELLVQGEGAYAGLLDEREVWIVPVVNPDGYVLGDRQNANEVDLNRNYGVEWKTSVFSGLAPFSEPETQAIRTLGTLAPPHAGLSLHSGALNLGYPWNHTSTPSDDEDGLARLGAVYTVDDEAFVLINGADWYITYGDTNDWSLGAHGAWDYTLEVSLEKSPDDPDALHALHQDAVAAFLAAPVALQGQVVDATTGLPLAATVVPSWGTPRVTSPVDGRFSRALATLDGELTVSSPGYQTVTVSMGTDVLVELDPLEPHAMTLVSTTSDATVGPLARPGFEDVPADTPVAQVPAGMWSSPTAHNAVFVSDPTLACRLWSVQVGDTLVVDGEGFGEGTLAFALGADRAWRPLEVLAESTTQVEVASPSLDGTVDLLLVSNGVEVAIADVLGEPVIDTSQPLEPEDTDVPEPAAQDAGYEGCASGGRRTLGWSLACALLFWRRTR